MSIKFTEYLDHAKLDHKQYQIDGVKWCVDNETCENPLGGVRGGFIADEMGLGKTITMIGTFVSNMMPKTLIVLPPILIDQWYQQIYKTTGHKSIIYHGANKKKITLEQLESSFIVITTYSAISSTLSTLSTLSTFKKSGAKPTKGGFTGALPQCGAKPTKGEVTGALPQCGAKIDTDLVDSDLAQPFSKVDLAQPFSKVEKVEKVEWNRIVFDEAHHLRNKNSRHAGAKSLRSKIRWLVSGTPVQNKKRDFYNLCSVLGLPASFYTDSANIPAIASSFILKRTKQQVGIRLPEMSANKNEIPWKNKNEYELSAEIHSNFGFANMPPIVKRRLLSGGDNYLSLLTKARQMCVLPSLIQKSLRLEEEHGRYYDEAMGQSSKIDEVVEAIIKKKDNGCGKLIFCHFRGEIDAIYQRLVAGGMTKVVRFDGRTKKRNEILAEKNDALILQIQTGCEGLNLQEFYSEIYFVSPHWNPAVEDQAIARCHRIGQTKNVFVERFTMGKFSGVVDGVGVSSTIDNYVTSVQDNKRLIANDIMSNA